MVTTSKWLKVVAAVAVVWGMAVAVEPALAGFVWADPGTAGWNDNPATYPYSKSMNLKDDSGNPDMTVTVVSGQNMRAHRSFSDAMFSAANPTNVAGRVISRFWPDNNESGPQPRTARYQIDFGIPITAGDILLLADFDDREEVQIQAFNGAYQPIDLSSWTFAYAQGHESSPYSYPPTWNPNFSGMTGQLIQPVTAIASEPLFLLYPNQAVKRLVLDFTLPTAGDPDFGIGAYQIEVSLIPEPSSLTCLAIGAVVGLAFARRVRSGRMARQ